MRLNGDTRMSNRGLFPLQSRSLVDQAYFCNYERLEKLAARVAQNDQYRPSTFGVRYKRFTIR